MGRWCLHIFFLNGQYNWRKNLIFMVVVDLLLLLLMMTMMMMMFCFDRFDSSLIGIEDGIPIEVINKLRSLGHSVEGPITGEKRSQFGRGQIITRGPVFRGREGSKESHPTLWAGSDPRADGSAIGYCVWFFVSGDWRNMTPFPFPKYWNMWYIQDS